MNKVHNLGHGSLTEIQNADGTLELKITSGEPQLPVKDETKLYELWRFGESRGKWDCDFDDFVEKCTPRSFGGALFRESTIRPEYAQFLETYNLNNNE